MIRGYTDVPVGSAEKDILNVQDYVFSLSDFIMECDTPMTIAIQGDWGCGKTSLMNMIRENLADKVISVWFNTWQFSQFQMSGYLPLALLSTLLEEIGGDVKLANKFGKVLGSIGKVATTFVLEKTVGEVNAERITGGSDVVDMTKEIRSLRTSLENAVATRLNSEKHKSKIAVFVDDLDRLSPEKAVELLEVMKLFLDLENCVFVLAVDYGIVTQGIRAKYGAYVDESKGKSFFDKLIQLPFVVPVNQYKVDAYIENLLRNMGVEPNEAKRDISLYKNLVEGSVGFNPRSLKRIFNAFLLLCNVAKRKGVLEREGVRESVVQRSLFAVLCLQMAFEDAYALLLKNIPAVDSAFLEEMCDIDKVSTDTRFASLCKSGYSGDLEGYRRLCDFMDCLIDAIQIDADPEAISREELDLFKTVLGFSSITSSLDSETVTRQKKTRGKDDFLLECQNDTAHFQYYSQLFAFLEKTNAFENDIYFGTHGFSIKKTIRCFPPSSRKSIEIDTLRIKDIPAASEILADVGVDVTKQAKRYIPLIVESFPVDRMLKLIDVL